MKREATRGKILEPLKIAEDVQNENTIASCDVSHIDLRDRTTSVKATTGKQNESKQQRANKAGVSNTTLEPLKHTPIIKTAQTGQSAIKKEKNYGGVETLNSKSSVQDQQRKT